MRYLIPIIAAALVACGSAQDPVPPPDELVDLDAGADAPSCDPWAPPEPPDDPLEAPRACCAPEPDACPSVNGCPVVMCGGECVVLYGQCPDGG